MITSRKEPFVFLLIHWYDKQLSPTSNFANDLGLDSLDTVEVVMAIEEAC